ncbi:fibronectin type III-like domain-contianing protein, partial [Pseudomonadota bacterium]
EVRNTGDIAADEVVQVYHSVNAEVMNQPISSLVGFQRVSLAPGETRVVRFAIAPEQLQAVNAAGKKVSVRGEHTLHIGGVSPGARGEELTGQALKAARFEVL